VIRVLAVDDSALMRRLLIEIFEAQEDFEIAFARDGVEALAMLHAFAPDVVILDVHMPNMNGIQCLNRIMLERPCPVVMFSTLTDAGAKETLDALELGAVDFLSKPSGAVSLQIEAFAPILVEKVRTAAKARLARSHRLTERVRLQTAATERARGLARQKPSMAKQIQPENLTDGQPGLAGEGLVLVGSSTGGPPALSALLEPLPADFPWPIVVAQHMPASFTGALAARLDRSCALEVSEVVRAVELRPGQVYIGRGDADVIISRRSAGLIALSAPSSSEHRWHPSVDRLVNSGMETVGRRLLIGVLLTGMGNDGAAAMTRLHANGGRTIAEAKETAVVWGMPGELVRQGGAEFVEPLDRIAGRLLAMTIAS
jgi:two-component system, chemotaxis family, protein-glutamate methylesterase/glutaminase